MFLPYLPDYSGPHKVGATEVEIPSSETSLGSDTLNTLETIKFRIFYPTDKKSNAKPASPLYWLPEPQKEWTEAYASFMGASSGWKALMTSSALSVLKYVKLPVIKDAILLPPQRSPHNGFPVCVFSHGLGGSFNSYSSVVGTLASHGVICIVPEHRDGSAPTAFIRNSQGQNSRSIAYEKISHNPTTQVLNARNMQLRTRLWELENIYTAIKKVNEGHCFSNFATVKNENDNNSWKRLQQELKGKMDLRPGRVTWAGHSFGAATTTQFVKSVFYHRDLPAKRNSSEGDWDWTPLASYTSNSPIVEQITADSPVALLDLWTMPLRGEPTKWLFDKPMPCYSRKSDVSSTSPSTIAIMSAEFYKWTDLLNRTRSLLSADPTENTEKASAQPLALPKDDTTRPRNPIAELSKQNAETDTSNASASRSPSPSPTRVASQQVSPSSSTTSLSQASTLQSDADPHEPHLYLVTQSAHLSQSDFGVLFPNLTKYVMKAIEPEKTLQLNLRAILAMMKGQGLPVEDANGLEEDEILSPQPKNEVRKEQRWVRVPLTGEVEQI